MKVTMLILVFALSNFNSFGQYPEILMFESGKCIRNEQQKELRITEQHWINDSTLIIGIKFYGNCCDDSYQDLTTESDTLTIHFGPDFETDSEGNITEVEHCLCNCNFEFKYLITNIKSNYLLRMRLAAAQSNSNVLAEIRLK